MAVAPPCDGLSRGRGSAGPSPTIPFEMAVTPLPDLVLYSRPGCGLCDETRELLAALLAERASADLARPTLVERDIEADPALERAYFASIPVVELGERRLELATSLTKLRRLLEEGLDG
jgi:glutaredoxin